MNGIPFYLIVALLVFPNGVQQDMNYTAIPFSNKINCLAYLDIEKNFVQESLDVYLDNRFGLDHNIKVESFTCKRDDELIWQDLLPGNQTNYVKFVTKK